MRHRGSTGFLFAPGLRIGGGTDEIQRNTIAEQGLGLAARSPMSLTRFEVGIVSADRTIVDFLAEVFGLDERPPMENPAGTLHRLESPGAVIKVMVPSEPPKPRRGRTVPRGEGNPVPHDVGQRFRRRASSAARRGGGSVLHGPFEYEPGTRLAVIADPDGNTIEVLEADPST